MSIQHTFIGCPGCWMPRWEVDPGPWLVCPCWLGKLLPNCWLLIMNCEDLGSQYCSQGGSEISPLKTSTQPLRNHFSFHSRIIIPARKNIEEASYNGRFWVGWNLSNLESFKSQTMRISYHSLELQILLSQWEQACLCAYTVLTRSQLNSRFVCEILVIFCTSHLKRASTTVRGICCRMWKKKEGRDIISGERQ